jgi:Putative beta-barrel porin-2, OmpL-like. bbp2
MRAVITTAVLLLALATALPPGTAQAQSVNGTEAQTLKDEIRRLNERLNKLEDANGSRVAPAVGPAQVAPAPAPDPAPTLTQPAPSSVPPSVPAGVVTAQVPPATGDREIKLERDHPFEVIGLPKPDVSGFRIGGFFVGSVNFNNRLQINPEFAGSAPASSRPGEVDFRFDQFTIGVYKNFAPWLSAGASIEIERHGHIHSHGFDPAFGCPGTGLCVEQFGAEGIETEVSLHRFYITGIAPLGNGVALSFGRFDTPYGYERHDAPLNLTATTSEVQRYGQPQSMTGFTAAYQFTPWLDATAWIVNRWENETTEDTLEDNNRDKSFGGRIGFTPLQGNQLLNFGIGGWWGPEQDDDTANKRWIVAIDVAYTPIPRLFLTGEFVYGREAGVSFRRVGIPVPGDAADDRRVSWYGLYALAHYDVTPWMGVGFRYGIFNDTDGARTGVSQTLQSFTLAPVVHLSRLIPDLRPVGVTYARSRHPLDWVDIRLEYRLNLSNRNVFSDASPAVPIMSGDKTSQQVTLQFVVNF